MATTVACAKCIPVTNTCSVCILTIHTDGACSLAALLLMHDEHVSVR